MKLVRVNKEIQIISLSRKQLQEVLANALGFDQRYTTISFPADSSAVVDVIQTILKSSEHDTETM